ncbi:MAG TPA: hypothetical protein VKU40_12815 [Thermoanaerobaculia bacterium]|nr:hypothetical protein [Thermoanaerobaculia bacterium]
MRARRWLLAAVLVCVQTVLTTAAAAEEPSLRALTPPDLTAPTPVEVSLYDVQIYRIDEREQTFEVGARLLLKWYDGRLAFDAAEAGTAVRIYQGEAAADTLDQEVWWPSLEIADSRGPRQRLHVELRVGANGFVAYDERFNAAIVQDFDLDAFPFDAHEVSLSIEPFTYDGSAVAFVAPEAEYDPISWQPTEWRINRSEVLVDDGAYEEGYGFSSATLFLEIERVSAHYMWKIVLPLLLIICVSSSVYWLDLERFPDPGDRLSVAFTAILTVVAFDFVTADSLPKLGYTTLLDQVLILAYLFAALNVAGVVVTTALSKRRPAAAQRLVTALRWLYPPAFVVCLLVVFVIG